MLCSVFKLKDILRENVEAGDLDAELLSQEELRKSVPEISNEALGGVFCPHEG